MQLLVPTQEESEKVQGCTSQVRPGVLFHAATEQGERLGRAQHPSSHHTGTPKGCPLAGTQHPNLPSAIIVIGTV